MSNLVAVLLNGIAQLEYDRDKPLTPYQQAYLDDMDRKMDAGVDVDGAVIKNPDENQRAQFVAANLHHAMKAGNEGLCSALCSYLASRMPELKQVRIDEEGDGAEAGTVIEFVFDEAYGKQAAVQFVMH